MGKETRIILTESRFTHLCKLGYFTHRSENQTKTDVYITKSEMKEIATGKVLEKQVGYDIVKFALQDIGMDLVREIVRRSPIYSEMAYEL